MREIRPSGSVRGVRRNPYPYRDPIIPVQSTVLFGTLAGTRISRLAQTAKPPRRTACCIPGMHLVVSCDLLQLAQEARFWNVGSQASR